MRISAHTHTASKSELCCLCVLTLVCRVMWKTDLCDVHDVRVHWVGSWSHWGLLQRCHSRRYRLTATQAWLHAYCLFTRAFHRSELAREFADNTVMSAKSHTKCRQFHFTELTDVVVCWLRPCNGTHRRLPCSALSSWHRPLRSHYNAAVSWFWFSCFCCMYWF